MLLFEKNKQIIHNFLILCAMYYNQNDITSKRTYEYVLHKLLNCNEIISPHYPIHDGTQIHEKIKFIIHNGYNLEEVDTFKRSYDFRKIIRNYIEQSRINYVNLSSFIDY